MEYTPHSLVLVVFCIITVPITAQRDCAYNSIRNTALSVEALLTWEASPFGECTIDHYIVYVTTFEPNEERVFMTDQEHLDVSFLDICETTRFVINPISPSGIQGQYMYFVESMPVPKNVNLTIQSVALSQTNEGVTLRWQLEEEFIKCAKRYRILVYDEYVDVPRDVYVTTPSINFNDLAACASYQFGITAVYNLEEEGPVTALPYRAPEAVMPPLELRSISSGTTAVDLVWKMESFYENRCPVSSVTVDASPYFRISYPVQDQNSRTYFLTSLTGLQPDTMYLLNVTATNNAGTTAPAIVAVQTLANN